MKTLISLHPYPSNLLLRFKLHLKYQERKEKEKMTSDSIAPTRNAVNLRRSSPQPLPTHRLRITLMSPPVYFHSLVMSLCGFIKGEGQSSCHSARKNREERRGSNRTPGKLRPKWGLNLGGRRDARESPPRLESKKTEAPDFKGVLYGPSQFEVSVRGRKECWCRSEIFVFESSLSLWQVYFSR